MADVDYYKLTAPTSFNGTLHPPPNVSVPQLSPRTSGVRREQCPIGKRVRRVGLGTNATGQLRPQRRNSYYVVVDGATRTCSAWAAYKLDAWRSAA